MTEKKFNPTNISALSRYVGITTACIFNYKKGKVPNKEMETLKLMLLGAGYTDKIDKFTKYKLIMKGWSKVCERHSK